MLGLLLQCSPEWDDESGRDGVRDAAANPGSILSPSSDIH